MAGVNGIELLNVAKRTPKYFQTVMPEGGLEAVKYYGSNFTIIRKGPNSYKESTFDSLGKHKGTMCNPRKDVPLTFHYGKINGRNTIDVYYGGYLKSKDIVRHTYNSLAELRKIISDAYKKMAGKTEISQK